MLIERVLECIANADTGALLNERVLECITNANWKSFRVHS